MSWLIAVLSKVGDQYRLPEMSITLKWYSSSLPKMLFSWGFSQILPHDSSVPHDNLNRISELLQPHSYEWTEHLHNKTQIMSGRYVQNQSVILRQQDTKSIAYSGSHLVVGVVGVIGAARINFSDPKKHEKITIYRWKPFSCSFYHDTPSVTNWKNYLHTKYVKIIQICIKKKLYCITRRSCLGIV